MSLTVQTPTWPEANFCWFPYETYVPSGACLVKISTSERMLAFQHRGGLEDGVFGVNRAAEGQAGRQAIATGKSMPANWLASPELPLRSILKQVA
jgi:hypothetical protein